MDSHAWTVKPIDPKYKIKPSDYDPLYMNIGNTLPVSTLIIGQSNSGKTTLLNNLLIKKLLWEYDPENIYFFSRTIMGDPSYRPILWYLAKNDLPINISKFVDFSIIDKIVDEQETRNINEMVKIEPGETDYDTEAEESKEEPPKKFLFIFDDILSDRQFKSYSSRLSTFSCDCRHSKVSMIINTQKYNKVPTTIREQSPLSILCSVDNYQDVLVLDHCVRGQKKQFDKMFSDMCLKKDHSFLIVSKYKKLPLRYLMYDGTNNTHEYLTL